MNIIVTGNSGFIGRYLTRKLLKKGYKVFGFDVAKTKDKVALNDANFLQKKVDLCSAQSVSRACKRLKDVKYVFHTVAIQPTSNQMDINDYLNVNLNGAANLLNACNEFNFKNIIVSSSFSVYGKPEYLPIDEKHPTNPNNVYGLTKLQAELLFEFYSRKMDFNIVILRYDGVYGVGQTIPGFIQYLIKSLSINEDVELFLNGKQKRDNVYVSDVIDSNIKAMQYLKRKQFSIFNIGGDEPKMSAESAKIVKDVLKSKSNIIISERGNKLMGYDIFMTSDKAKRILGYKPKGLRKNVQYMIKGIKGGNNL